MVEAQTITNICDHPSIASVFAHGATVDGRPHLAMTKCRSVSLLGHIRKEPLPVAEALDIGIRIAGAVEHAHRAGVLHGDIRPSNVLFDRFRQARLTDFRIAGFSGTVVSGRSLDWVAPEQHANEEPTAASDIYSLSATVWAMISGHTVLRDRHRGGLDPRGRGRLPDVGRPGVPLLLMDVLRGGMSEIPSERPSSALELARSLQDVQAELGLPVTLIDLAISDIPDRDLKFEVGNTTRIGPFGDLALVVFDVLTTVGGVAGGWAALRSGVLRFRKGASRYARLTIEQAITSSAEAFERRFGHTIESLPAEVIVQGTHFRITWHESGHSYVAEGMLDDRNRVVKLTATRSSSDWD